MSNSDGKYSFEMPGVKSPEFRQLVIGSLATRAIQWTMNFGSCLSEAGELIYMEGEQVVAVGIGLGG